MSISVVQEAMNSSSSVTGVSSFSVTLSSNVTAGNSLHVYGMCTAGNGQSLNAPTDGHDTFHLIGSVADSVEGRTLFHWYTNNSIGGFNTVTIAFANFADNQWMILVREIGNSQGYDSGATIPANGGQLQAAGSYTAGTNCWTTGNFTPASQPGLASCVCICNGAPAMAAGTGFSAGIAPTLMGSNVGGTVMSESLRYTSLTAFAMTITQTTANTPYAGITMGALFVEGGDTLLGQAVL